MAEVILALDLPRGADALALVDQIPDLRWVKVGPVLLTREGPGVVRELIGRGLHVFLDLKWHDIPNTVAGAVQIARADGIAMATVHTLGGPGMLEAAAVAAGPDLGLVGVTVLTSHDGSEYGRAVGRSGVDLEREVERLALLGMECGLRGVVCSPSEVASVRRRIGSEAWIVAPGIRRFADSAEDQRRTAPPRQAVRDGATHLVVGRPLLQAADPGAVYHELLREAMCA